MKPPKIDLRNIIAVTIAAIVGVLLMVALTGCNATRFISAKPDGSVVSVSNQRLFWATESYSLIITSNTATLKATKANASADAMGAVAEGVARGITTGIK